MTYVQFYQKESYNSNKIVESIGSDSIFILDGRFSIYNMIETSKKRYEYIKNCNSNIVAFAIFKGNSLFNSYQITNIINL